MKKLILLTIMAFFLAAIAAIGQDSNSAVIEQNISNNIKDALIEFGQFLNYIFIITFILIAWVINDSIDAENFGSNTTFLNRIPRVLRSLIIGVLIAFVFIWGFEYNKRIEIMSLFFSLIVSMVIYQVGIKKALRFISERILRLKFNNE